MNLTTISGVGTEWQHGVCVAVLDVELPDHALHVHHLEDKASNLIVTRITTSLLQCLVLIMLTLTLCWLEGFKCRPQDNVTYCGNYHRTGHLCNGRTKIVIIYLPSKLFLHTCFTLNSKFTFGHIQL